MQHWIDWDRTQVRTHTPYISYSRATYVDIYETLLNVIDTQRNIGENVSKLTAPAADRLGDFWGDWDISMYIYDQVDICKRGNI